MTAVQDGAERALSLSAHGRTVAAERWSNQLADPGIAKGRATEGGTSPARGRSQVSLCPTCFNISMPCNVEASNVEQGG